MAQFDGQLDLAKSQVALRALRYGHFPNDIFDEYAWDMLLHLFIAHLRKQTLYSDNLINLTSKNAIVGERWLNHLQKETMVLRDGEAVALSPQAIERMSSYHDQALAAIAA